MLGYTAETIIRKAEKRGISPEAYEAYLVRKRQTRAERHRASVADKRAEELAEKANRANPRRKA